MVLRRTFSMGGGVDWVDGRAHGRTSKMIVARSGRRAWIAGGLGGHTRPKQMREYTETLSGTQRPNDTHESLSRPQWWAGGGGARPKCDRRGRGGKRYFDPPKMLRLFIHNINYDAGRARKALIYEQQGARVLCGWMRAPRNHNLANIMINSVLTQYFGRWENIAQVAHKGAPFLRLRSWRISQAGSGAGVCVCGGLHCSRLGMRHPFKCTVLLWAEGAHPCPCGGLWADWAGRARAWVLWGV